MDMLSPWEALERALVSALCKGWEHGAKRHQQLRGEGPTTGSPIKEQRGTVKGKISLDLVFFVLHLVLTFSFQERLEKSRAENIHVWLQGTHILVMFL